MINTHTLSLSLFLSLPRSFSHTQISGVGQVATVIAGNYFGELGLMLAEGRKASIKALQDCSLLELRQPDFFGVMYNVMISNS